MLNLFDLSLHLKGFPIAEAKRFLRDIQAVHESDFKAYVKKQRSEIVQFHLKNNAFYNRFAGHANPNDWNSLPVMTKAELQQPLQERISKGFTPKNVHKHKSSGSAGHPFTFAKDKFCHALTWAVFHDRYGWFGLDLNRSLQARFYGIPLNKASYYKERFKDVLSKRKRFSVFDLSDGVFETILKSFGKNNFEYLNGYTSSIVQFAKFLKRKHVVLNRICPTLKCCIVTSEMLFEDDKTLMEKQFGIPVINEYGASETGLIAFESTQGKWLLSSDDLFVEILDKNNNVLPYGEAGRIVVTTLYNKAHPFIRYDIGDVGSLSKNSTFKAPVLEKLTGRTNDFVRLPSGKTAAGLTFYYITKSIIEDDGKVKEFVIEQTELDTFKILYVSDETLSTEQGNRIKKAMDTYLESGLIVVFEKQTVLDRSNRGKLKQFVSRV